MTNESLLAFVAESNRIEGIVRDPLPVEIDETKRLLALHDVGVEDLRRYVSAVAGGAPLRNKFGMGVSVGRHYPPPGGAEVEITLRHLLADTTRGRWGEGLAAANVERVAFNSHLAYERLHPFMDGNGRSGRVLWLWVMLRTPQTAQRAEALGFLHAWYYQSLEFGGPR